MTQASVENTADDFYKFEGKTGDGFGSWHEPNPRYGGITSDSDTFRENDDGRGGVTEISYKAKDGTTKTRKVGSSMYPKNHVRVSESGHVEEWDDTPYAERLHRYHKTGTFEEIQADGTKITKVTGDDYEIVAGHDDNSGNKKVFIYGNCDLTIMKDVRLKVEGSMVHEVTGNYHLNVHGDMRTKITGNYLTEVLSQRKTTVNLDDALTVGDSQSITVGASGKGSCSIIVAETYGVESKDIGLDTTNEFTVTSGSNMALGSSSTIGIIGMDTNIGAAKNVWISGVLSVNVHSGGVINLGEVLTPIINIASFPGGMINILGGFITNEALEMISLAAPSINSAGMVVSTEATAIAELGGVHVMESGLIFLN